MCRFEKKVLFWFWSCIFIPLYLLIILYFLYTIIQYILSVFSVLLPFFVSLVGSSFKNVYYSLLPLVAAMSLTTSVMCVFCRVPLCRSQPVAAPTISPPSCLWLATPGNSYTSLSWTTFLCLSSQSHSGNGLLKSQRANSIYWYTQSSYTKWFWKCGIVMHNRNLFFIFPLVFAPLTHTGTLMK